MSDFYLVHRSLCRIRLDLSMPWSPFSSLKSTPASHNMLPYNVADLLLPNDRMNCTFTGDVFRLLGKL